MPAGVPVGQGNVQLRVGQSSGAGKDEGRGTREARPHLVTAGIDMLSCKVYRMEPGLGMPGHGGLAIVPATRRAAEVGCAASQQGGRPSSPAKQGRRVMHARGSAAGTSSSWAHLIEGRGCSVGGGGVAVVLQDREERSTGWPLPRSPPTTSKPHTAAQLH